MDPISLLLIGLLIAWLIYKYLFASKDQSKTKDTRSKNRSSFSSLFTYTPQLPFDNAAISWCANFLVTDKANLINILKHPSSYYSNFMLSKRKGGYRMISAPNASLLTMQNTIYKRVLFQVNIHPAATGFRPKTSIVDNAEKHLGKEEILKVDIMDFFGSIKKHMVLEAFENIGYPREVAKVLTQLCVLNRKLPQGAPTSPALSNIIAYAMDVKLSALASEYNLTYTRYADDLTFSGDHIPMETILPAIEKTLASERFYIQKKKTKYLTKNKRKIITGISISSREKLTIPKAKKREIRQKVHYILTRGLNTHQQHIGSKDPSYLKRVIGYLNFWHTVEPNNQYVISSLEALNKLR